jgi:hypothetical protein
MKIILLLALVFSTTLNSVAQDREKRLPGPFLIWGPVHTIRDERVTITSRNGESTEGPRTLVQIFTFNEDGTHQRREFFTGGSLERTIVDVFTADGKHLETIESKANGDLISRTLRKYDDKMLTEEIKYGPDGNELSKRTRTRIGGQIREEIENYSKGTITSRASSTYDPSTRTSDSVLQDRQRVTNSRIVTSPGPDGTTVIEKKLGERPVEREALSRMGESGEQHITYNPDGTVKRKERRDREFDAHGNLIKQVRLFAEGDSNDFVPVEILYRTIDYYNRN